MEWNFISLRDIERAMVIFKWFLENHNMFDQELRKIDRYQVIIMIMKWTIVYFATVLMQECQAETRALILSLAVNYHARITDKSKFEEEVCSQIQFPLQKMTKESFVDEITRCFFILYFYCRYVY